MLILTSSLFAYKNGDTISQEMGTALSLKENKIYLVDFFASWCGSCKKELPLISKLNSSLNKSKYEIIGIDTDKNIDNGIAFQNKLKENNHLNFRVINDNKNIIISSFKPIGMPTLYYIQNNKIIGVLTGAVDNIDHVIQTKLQEME